MNDELKKKVKRYVTTSVISLAVAISLLVSFGFFSGTLSDNEKMKALSDAFTVPGIVLLALGALIYASTEGMFDGLSYAGKYAIRALVPGMRNSAPLEKYGDYKLAKNEKRAKGYSFLFFIGLAFAFIGIIFTALFYVI